MFQMFHYGKILLLLLQTVKHVFEFLSSFPPNDSRYGKIRNLTKGCNKKLCYQSLEGWNLFPVSLKSCHKMLNLSLENGSRKIFQSFWFVPCLGDSASDTTTRHLLHTFIWIIGASEVFHFPWLAFWTVSLVPPSTWAERERRRKIVVT